LGADEALLRVALRHRVRADDAASGVAQVAALAGEPVEVSALHEAVARAVAAGLIADPVRLPQGALQCHWQLDLTPAGRAAAQALPSGDRLT
jgi:hypothetical protein